MARTSHLAKPATALVLETLQKQRAAMSAYALLDALRAHGINSPPIIYRALAQLESEGQVHKVHALGSYVACAHAHQHHAHALSLLSVCVDCKTVEEVQDGAIVQHIEQLRGLGMQLAEQATVELPVRCAACLATH